MHKAISKILEQDGFFFGGFVRDFLIRGEKFSDIDYCFSNSSYLELMNAYILDSNFNNKIDLANLMEISYIDGLNFHYSPVRGYYYDLSCNLFGFDKNGFFPLPSFHSFDLNKAWELLINKKFFKLCDGRLTIKKMIRNGWECVGEIDDMQDQIICHNKNGIWNSYNNIAIQRLNELIYQ